MCVIKYIYYDNIEICSLKIKLSKKEAKRYIYVCIVKNAM